MLISHTIITVAAVQSALSLWTRVATSGFTWTASLPTSLTASLWEPVRWGHLFKYSAPLCLWRLCAFGAPDAAVPHPLRLLSAQEKPITGRKADVIQAAHLCAEAALRLVKPGNQVSLKVSCVQRDYTVAIYISHCFLLAAAERPQIKTERLCPRAALIKSVRILAERCVGRRFIADSGSPLEATW